MYSDGSTRDITSFMKSWTSSNPEIATISATGVVTGLAPGKFRVSATYWGLEAAWEMHVFQSPYRPPEPNEVTGRVRGANGEGSIEVWPAEVEVVSGPSVGRRVETIFGGFFRLDGLQSPDFDLMVRRRGYVTTRVHVAELGREMRIDLALAPGIMTDVVEGDVCNPTRTITRTFTPAERGFLRITGSLYQNTSRVLVVGSVVIQNDIPNNQDIELEAGVTYEIRLTGRCGESFITRGGVMMLRPFD
jgi:hypothetical protein